MRSWLRSLGFLTLVFLLATCELSSQGEQAVQPDKPKGDKPAVDSSKSTTAKVEKGLFKIEVTIKGVFEAQHMAEVALRPEAWAPQTGGLLILRKAAEHGAPVKKGDPILWLDTEKLDNTLRDLENDRQMAVLTLRQAEEELPILEKAGPRDLAAAERFKKIADEDLERYTKVEREWMEKSAKQMVKSYSQYLEYAKEELKQLEKMYRSKDLTEETEEIILKRQRNQVESIAFNVKLAELELEQTLKFDLPRRDHKMNDTAFQAALILEKARSSIPTTLSQKRLALAKANYDLKKTSERLDKLKRDRENMIVKAPIEGILYHGKCVRGQWQSGGMIDRLRVGGMLQADEVLLTVVQAKPIFVRAEVEEKDLQYLKEGTKGRATPTLAPDVKLATRVDQLSLVPISSGKFDARLSVEMGKEAPTLMPGMACSIKLVPYLKEQALTVPTSAVFTEDADEDQHYVYLVHKDGKNTKHTVKVGKKSDKRTEILEGLQEGDEILTDKPGPAKKPETPSKEAKP